MPEPSTARDGGYSGYLLHTYHQPSGGRLCVFAIGRLNDGRTFGVVETRLTPCFYVRAADRGRLAACALPRSAAILPDEHRDMQGGDMLRVEAAHLSALRRVETMLDDAGVPTFEADVPLYRRFLMERGIRGPVIIRGEAEAGRRVDLVFRDAELTASDHEPRLSVLSIDLETTPDHGTITAAGLVLVDPFRDGRCEEAHVLGNAPQDGRRESTITVHANETALVTTICERVRALDPDILTGWHVAGFDLPVLEKRCKARSVPFRVGRTRDLSVCRSGTRFGGDRVRVHGRQVVDALQLARQILRDLPDHRLETVAQSTLKRGKLLPDDSGGDRAELIERTRRDNPALFADYCLEDARLVCDILETTGMLERTLRRSLLTGLPLERAWGSVAAFEFLYIAALHERNIVAPTLDTDRHDPGTAPGGLVLQPRPGLYDHVEVFDFKSLYPSIMRTFHIDPLSASRAGNAEGNDPITAPNGTTFHRAERGILPKLLDRFWTERDRAKACDDTTGSFTYKILMNSFYGVLGTRACRFGSSRLAGAITSFGHGLLRWCRDYLENAGYPVIYGDTDSLFVHLGTEPGTSPDRPTGNRLAAEVNAALDAHIAEAYRVPSRLELEFEKHYDRFLLPHARGNVGRGRAKGYAGRLRGAPTDRVDIVGMEAVRSDWTEMAHRFQREILALLFDGADAPRLEAFTADWVAALKNGEWDDHLVYRTRLRRPLDSYTKTTPPHVRAARLMDNPSGTISYVWTCDGPQPADARTASMDYAHYISKQLEPLVKTIAPYCGLDVGAAVRGELRLF